MYSSCEKINLFPISLRTHISASRSIIYITDTSLLFTKPLTIISMNARPRPLGNFAHKVQSDCVHRLSVPCTFLEKFCLEFFLQYNVRIHCGKPFFLENMKQYTILFAVFQKRHPDWTLVTHIQCKKPKHALAVAQCR